MTPEQFTVLIDALTNAANNLGGAIMCAAAIRAIFNK